MAEQYHATEKGGALRMSNMPQPAGRAAPEAAGTNRLLHGARFMRDMMACILIVVLTMGPWVYLVVLQYEGRSLFVILLTAVLLMPIAVLGVWTIAGALVMAVAVDLTLILLNIVAGLKHPTALIVVAWLSIALGIGLARKLSQRLKLNDRVVRMTSLMSVMLLCGLMVYAVPAYEIDWKRVLIGAAAGILIGAVAGRYVLAPGIEEFSGVAPYLDIMKWPVIGFFAGYLTLGMLFAGYYVLLYHMDKLAFDVPKGSSVWDFVYFSLMALLPIGHTQSAIHPTSIWTNNLVAMEAMLGVAWVVVVFAALIAYLNPRFEKIAERQGIIADVRVVGEDVSNPGTGKMAAEGGRADRIMARGS